MQNLEGRSSRQPILEQVKRVIFRQLEGNSAKVYLFGSWARAEEKRSSDIDVAIEFPVDEPTHHKLLAKIRTALEESTIPYKVDVVHMNEADEAIVNKVKEEGILWEDRGSE